MKGLTETDYKYLAGLMDADGWISFKFQTSASTGKTYLQLQLGVACSDKIDRGGEFISWLQSHCGTKSQYKDERKTSVYVWNMQKRTELNQFIPRIIKHMLIKAKHFDRLYSAYDTFKGKTLDSNDISTLKALSIESRKDAGPIKEKNYPSKAWVAGFLDGDGHYGLHKRKRDNYVRLSIDALVSETDSIALELLQKSYGGEISYKQEHPRWYRGLGKQHRTFAISFLKTMHRHSRLKRWKIEQMLAFHNCSCND